MLGRSGEVLTSTHPVISRILITSFLKLRVAVAVHAIKGVPAGTSARSSAMEPNDGRKSLLLNAIELSRFIY